MKWSSREHVANRARRGGLRWPDVAVLAAVGLVVLLVSLPRLREFALRENESDARALVAKLGSLCQSDARAGSRSIGDLIASAPNWSSRLDDVELLDGGRLLRRHGYLFELGREASAPQVIAWPWEHGRTGCSAFRWTARGLEGHANDAGAWSGLDAFAFDAESGWRALETPR